MSPSGNLHPHRVCILPHLLRPLLHLASSIQTPGLPSAAGASAGILTNAIVRSTRTTHATWTRRTVQEGRHEAPREAAAGGKFPTPGRANQERLVTAASNSAPRTRWLIRRTAATSRAAAHQPSSALGTVATHSAPTTNAHRGNGEGRTGHLARRRQNKFPQRQNARRHTGEG